MSRTITITDPDGTKFEVYDRYSKAFKALSRALFHQALKDGLITPEEHCEGCGRSDVRLHGHHQDYGWPCHVNWLCRDCHLAAHGWNWNNPPIPRTFVEAAAQAGWLHPDEDPFCAPEWYWAEDVQSL